MAIGIGTAIIGGSAISGILGSKASSSAAKASARGAEAAAEATIESTRMQIEEIGRQFDYQVKILQPQIQLQFNAQRAYHDLLGIGGPELGEPPPGVDFEADATKQRDQEIAGLTSQLNTLRGKQGQALSKPRYGGPRHWEDRRNELPRPDPALEAQIAEVENKLQAAKSSTVQDRVQQMITEQGPVMPGAGEVFDTPEDARTPTDIFRSTPGYEFRLEEMDRATERIGSRGGPNIGGRAIMEAQRRAKGLADQDFYNYLGAVGGAAGFSNPAGTAVNAAGGAGAAAAGAYSNQGNALAGIYQNQGNTQADLDIMKYASFNNAIQGGLSNYFTAKTAGMI